jgi:hypothetical protein
VEPVNSEFSDTVPARHMHLVSSWYLGIGRTHMDMVCSVLRGKAEQLAVGPSRSVYLAWTIGPVWEFKTNLLLVS